MTTPPRRRATWPVFALLLASGLVAVVMKRDSPTLASILIGLTIAGLVAWLMWVTRRTSANDADKGAPTPPADVWGPDMRADRLRAEREELKGKLRGGPGRAWRWHVPDNWPLRSDEPPKH